MAIAGARSRRSKVGAVGDEFVIMKMKWLSRYKVLVYCGYYIGEERIREESLERINPTHDRQVRYMT